MQIKSILNRVQKFRSFVYGNARQVVDLTKVDGGNPVLVSIKMADGARNNWSCNVLLHWDNPKPPGS